MQAQPCGSPGGMCRSSGLWRGVWVVGALLFCLVGAGAEQATALSIEIRVSEARATSRFPTSQPLVLVGLQSAAPLEDQLSAGTTGFLRLISKRFRQMKRVVANAMVRWRSWLGGALVFLGLAVVAPVVDRSVLEVWRREGLVAFWRAMTAGVAVYVRLLRDGRAPAVGKALIAFAVIYGVANRDLMVDAIGIVGGLADDFLLIVLTSRGFMRMCPDEIVEEHAMRVAAARAGS